MFKKQVRGKKQIVIIEASPVDMLAKISYVLKKKGYETVSVSIIGSPEHPFLKEAYDKRIFFNFKFFKLKIRNFPSLIFYIIKRFPKIIGSIIRIMKLNPYILIGRSNPHWALYLFRKLFFRNIPFVYFPYDIRSSLYKDFDEIKKTAKTPDFEIRAERYFFENSDGVISKGSEHELENLNENILGKDINIGCPTIYFFPYCLEEFMVPINYKDKLSFKDKRPHVVFAGSLNTEKRWLDIIKSLLSQKIHVHVYGKTSNLTSEEFDKRISAGYKNFINKDFFHIHKPVDQRFLSKELSKYDYGIFSLDKKGTLESMSTGNKFSSYLESGVAIINMKNFEVLAKMVDEYGIGINLSDSEVKSLSRIIKKKDYKLILSNVEKARKQLSMRNHILRLEKFFEQAINHKRLNHQK